MKRALGAVVIATCLLAAGTTPALASQGVPQRPAGPVVSGLLSDNGGDNGWGNCGHNSSGGNAPVDGGNGGFSRTDSCLGESSTTDPTTPTKPTKSTGPTQPVLEG